MPRPRGYTLLLVMTVIAAAGFSFTVMATRLSVSTVQRELAQVRTQALWLGRSAITAGATGTTGVATPVGKAAVQVARKDGRTVATVVLPGGTAVVSLGGEAGWEERYEAR